MKYALIAVVFLAYSCTVPTKTEEMLDFSFAGELLPSPSGENASLPHLIKGGDNNLYLSWVEKKNSNWVELKFSRLVEEKWSEPELISSGNDWFVNWADYPMIAADKDGNMIAHYLAKSSSGTYSYDVNVVIKPASADTWSTPIIPHKDGTPTEHGFVTMLPQNDGTFLLSWLDGRNTGGGEHSETGHGNDGAMTIRTATLDMNGNLNNEVELDNRVCDCCQTGGVMTSSGPVIVYRDRSMKEVRDMSFVRKVNDTWTTPKSIANDNWNIAGCPVNGPSVTANNDQLATAWFTAANDTPIVKVAFSKDDGFDKPITIDENQPLGRVDVVILNEESAMVSWMTNEDEKTVIKARTVSKNGYLGVPFTITETNGSRGSGFPQMEIIENEVYFAWTHLQDEGVSILMRKLNLK